MYVDEDERQMTLGAFAASTPEVAREAARKHAEYAERFDRAGVEMAGLENAVYGESAVDIREWLELSPDAQADLLERRLEHLKDELKADVDPEPADPEPAGPEDYRGRRPENAPGDAWGYE